MPSVPQPKARAQTFNGFSQPPVQPQLQQQSMAFPSNPSFQQQSFSLQQQRPQIPQLSQTVVNQFVFVCAKINELMPQSDEAVLQIVRNLVVMQPNQIQALKFYYQQKFQVQLIEDVGRIGNVFIQSCCRALLLEQHEVMVEQITIALQNMNYIDLTTALLVPSEAVVQTALKYYLQVNQRQITTDLEQLFQQQEIYQQLLYYYCLVQTGQMPNCFITSESDLAQ